MPDSVKPAAPFDSLGEDEIALMAQKGDQAALNFLMSRYVNVVKAKAKAYYLIGADGEDIIQEGMIGLYKAVRDYKPEKTVSFRVFADLCITRQIITAIKTATRQKHIPLNSYVSFSKPVFEDETERTLVDVIGASEVSNPEELIIGKEDYALIEGLIDRMLSDLEFEVLCQYTQGKSYQEIARTLGKSVKSVDNAIQRIKKKFERILSGSPTDIG